MKPIVLPVPQFQFGEIVFIEQEHSTTTYEDCLECFGGKLNVVGAVGITKTVSCPKCSGSGHTHKVKSREKWREIDGLLEITSVQVELSENPRDDGWSRDGVHYQGRVMWRDDISDEQKRGNIFREAILKKIN
jgi:hypothetical protein